MFIENRMTLAAAEDPRSPYADMMLEAVAEIARLRNGNAGACETVTLTDAERSAIADAADRYAEITPESAETAGILRALLVRLSRARTIAAECCSRAQKSPEQELLTDAERSAVVYSLSEVDGLCPEVAATLRSLLDRMG
jgi:hypothetical protein